MPLISNYNHVANLSKEYSGPDMVKEYIWTYMGVLFDVLGVQNGYI